MTIVAFLRHGPTAWNESKRLQGMTDVPLSDAGRAQVSTWTVPPDMVSWRWQCSPLARARETARLLRAGRDADPEPALREMSFGTWEGYRLADLRREFGAEMEGNEARGVDLVPPGGESPRQVMERLQPWLASVAREGRSTVAVTHKGVIRVVLAMATGWDMKGRQPLKLDWQSMHLFRAQDDGSVVTERLNVPLVLPGDAGRTYP
ncbi:histidine phosphatase family protein [Reyranella sp. CPCC 100927]|uniref:histidine phosphatase family protein n=1 Tax=Reyranella sp. CPCC 100927 TaxID=2599616 RepID=UPI0011B8376C|nr:histidine phosphatase family protein [Reyranella sp. CPCC 100927]TWS99622.1 histidine phosphatase family protein [Reyranella sp. CPCC 100927]